MIKADSVKFAGTTADGKNKVVASLLADTKAEVVAQGTSCDGIVGLSADDVLTFGSTCCTTSFEVGMLQSNDTWKF